MSKSEGDSGVKTGWIFQIGVRLLDIRKAHKKHINTFDTWALLILNFRVNDKSTKIIIAAQN